MMQVHKQRKERKQTRKRDNEKSEMSCFAKEWSAVALLISGRGRYLASNKGPLEGSRGVEVAL